MTEGGRGGMAENEGLCMMRAGHEPEERDRGELYAARGARTVDATLLLLIHGCIHLRVVLLTD